MEKVAFGREEGNGLYPHPDEQACAGYQGTKSCHKQGGQFVPSDLDGSHIGSPYQSQQEKNGDGSPLESCLMHGETLPQGIFFGQALPDNLSLNQGVMMAFSQPGTCIRIRRFWQMWPHSLRGVRKNGGRKKRKNGVQGLES
jgi:hypothetical protein